MLLLRLNAAGAALGLVRLYRVERTAYVVPASVNARIFPSANRFDLARVSCIYYIVPTLSNNDLIFLPPYLRRQSLVIGMPVYP